MYVFQSALPSVAARGFVQREKPLPALAWRARARVEQEVGFGGEAQERGAEDAGVPFTRLAGNFRREEVLLCSSAQGSILLRPRASRGRCRAEARRYI